MTGVERTSTWPSPALLAMPDGKIHLERYGDLAYLVTKYDGQLALWITSLQDSQTNFVQTQISLLDPLNLSLPYTQAMSLGLLWANPPQTICLLGLGGGAMARALHDYLPGSRLDCVDVSAIVIRLAQEYFGVVPNERLQCHQADAAGFLRYSKQAYDLILTDVSEDKGRIPRHLGTRDFFALCENRLSPAGVTVVNISSAAPDHLARADTFRASFNHVARLAVSPQTTIWFGSREKRWDRSAFKSEARRMQRSCRFRFPFVEWVDRVEHAPPLTAAESEAHVPQTPLVFGPPGASEPDRE